MAIVKINQIRSTLGKAVAYIADAYKTDGQTLVSSNASLTPKVDSIVKAFKDVQDLADSSRVDGKRPSVVGIHLIQSFSPGEVSPQEAHQVGIEFIERISGGQYQYVIATHVDRHHIHNHIIMNPCSSVTLKRWRCGKGRLAQLRELSDDVCLKHGLSVIEKPGRDAISLGEVYARTRGVSNKETLRDVIDQGVFYCRDMGGLQRFLRERGIEAVNRRGSLVLRDRPDGKGMRSERLGLAYSQAALMSRLGRAERQEFVVRRGQVENLNGERLLVRVPGLGDGGALVVSRTDLVDNGTSFRLFLNVNRSYPVVDKFDRSGGNVTASQLQWLLTMPREANINAQTDRAPVRGASAAQQRYYAYIDRRVAQLRATSRQISADIELGSMSPAQLQSHIEGLKEQIRQGRAELTSLIVDKQRRIDTGQSTADVDSLIDAKTQQVSETQEKLKAAIKVKGKQKGRSPR